jgi:hypothetical protein
MDDDDSAVGGIEMTRRIKSDGPELSHFRLEMMFASLSASLRPLEVRDSSR